MTIEGGSERLRVWCLLRDQHANVRPVEAAFGERASFTYDAEWDPAGMIRERPHVVLCVNDWPSEIARCLDAARAAGIPSLVLQDGILEWRCQYENPLFGAGGGAPQHQPVLADKIACIGYQSARQLAAWGNAAKVEVAGMPRLDGLLGRPAPRFRHRPRRVLVMTAKRAGFTPDQVRVTVRSLQDVARHLRGDSSIEVLWRVDPQVAHALGIQNTVGEFATAELARLLEQVDAVITAPSTAMLEAMLLHLPVAALDYHNVPRYVPTAWTISAPEHIAGTLGELLAPPSRKLLFQRECLEDVLRCDGPAADRVAALLVSLASASQKSQVASAHDDHRALHAPAPVRPQLADLYPDQPLYQDNDIQALQVRIARLERDNLALRRQLELRRTMRRLLDRGTGLFRRASGGSPPAQNNKGGGGRQ